MIKGRGEYFEIDTDVISKLDHTGLTDRNKRFIFVINVFCKTYRGMPPKIDDEKSFKSNLYNFIFLSLKVMSTSTQKN